MVAQAPYVVLENVTFRGPQGPVFAESRLCIGQGERWAVVGPTGSGKGVLLEGLMGRLSLLAGQLRHPFIEGDPRFVDSVYGVLPPGSMALASMNQHSQLLLARDFHQMRWHGSFTEGTGTVDAFLERSRVEARNPFAVLDEVGAIRFASARQREIQRFELGPLLSRPLVALSNGELHRLLLARALMLDPGFLLLDEPFAGLDAHHRKALVANLDALHGEGRGVLLATSLPDKLPLGISHIVQAEKGRIVFAGPREKWCPAAGSAIPAARTKVFPSAPAGVPLPLPDAVPLLDLREVSVRHGAATLLDRVSMRMEFGEHWALLGPNGSGKSTLLSLILADNPQAYANDIVVAGQKLGPGVSIWDRKALLGWVSPELDTHYPPGASTFEVVLSGFASSLGAYRPSNREEEQAASDWIASLRLASLRDRFFAGLTTAERRRTLLARAAVHRPRLLILDEPCQGLDQAGREGLLTDIEATASALAAGMIFVTHDPGEIPTSVTQVLVLDTGHVRYIGPRDRYEVQTSQ